MPKYYAMPKTVRVVRIEGERCVQIDKRTARKQFLLGKTIYLNQNDAMVVHPTQRPTPINLCDRTIKEERMMAARRLRTGMLLNVKAIDTPEKQFEAKVEDFVAKVCINNLGNRAHFFINEEQFKINYHIN